jgi:Putative peptidoglycan binding domain
MKNFPFEAEPFELEVRRAGTPSHAEEESYDREKAIRLNRCMSEWLGWIDYRQEIYALLGFPRTCPTEAALADAVRRWQQERRMTADGILGLQTLNSLHAPLGRPALAAEPARPAWMRWEPSPNFSSRDGRAIDTIVLHATGGGSVQGALQRFKNRKVKPPRTL